MKTRHTIRTLALVSLGLVACSGDSPDLGLDGGDEHEASVPHDASRDATDSTAPEAGDDARSDAHVSPDAETNDAGDAGEPDATLHDADVDGNVTPDAGPDASLDASQDATIDTGTDAATDSAAHDASIDAPHDAHQEDAADAEPHDAAADAPTCNACAFACVQGVCKGVCHPGATRCSPHGSDYCTESGFWHTQVGQCSASCMAPAGRYVVSADAKTVQDSTMGLVWQRTQPPATNDWSAAAAYCSALDLDGMSGRLPTVAELSSIVIATPCVPAIDQAAFPGASTVGTWTSEAATQGNVHVIDFALGAPALRPSGATGAVRCVRSL